PASPAPRHLTPFGSPRGLPCAGYRLFGLCQRGRSCGRTASASNGGGFTGKVSRLCLVARLSFFGQTITVLKWIAPPLFKPRNSHGRRHRKRCTAANATQYR